jgi:hypothetical protein
MNIYLTIIIYAISIFFFYFAIKSELKDIRCSDKEGTICGEGMGRTYYIGHPDETDDIETLLEKIRLSSIYELRTILWRKSLIVAMIISFIIIYLIKGKIPDGDEFVIGVAISYIAIYTMLNFFQNAISIPATNQLKRCIEMIMEKKDKKKKDK